MGSELACAFVYPILSGGQQPASLEPDKKPIAEDQPRAAILFGPAGTSKTTLARAVAGAIGWEYVELHASHFVAEGLPSVQRTADEIFQRLMELDSAVVLFDEIDELVREREEKGADTFGRFLTTSMLPKLAELWAQRKILYFVATNHVKWFDAAVIRSQRFDLLLPVPPPSFHSKIERLRELLGQKVKSETVRITVTQRDIDSALYDIGKSARDAGLDVKEVQLAGQSEEVLDPDLSLAKFVLLRWDQLDELAHRLAASPRSAILEVSKESLAMALKEIRDNRLNLRRSYLEFISDCGYSRRDFSKVRVWEVDGVKPDEPLPEGVVEVGGRYWVRSFADEEALIAGGGFEPVANKLATLRLRTPG